MHKLTQNGSQTKYKNKTTKLLEENIRVNSHDLTFGNESSDMTQKGTRC